MNNGEYNALVEKLAEEIIVDTAKRVEKTAEGNFGQPESFSNMEKEQVGTDFARGGEASKSIGQKFLEFIKGKKKVQVGPNVVADASSGDYSTDESKVAEYEEIQLVKTAAEKAFSEADNYIHSESIKEAAVEIYNEAVEKEATLAYIESQMLKEAAEQAYAEAEQYADCEEIKTAAEEVYIEADEVEKTASEFLASKTINEAASAYDYSQNLKTAAEQAYAEAEQYEDCEAIKEAAEEIYQEALIIEKEAGEFLVEIEKVAQESAEEEKEEEKEEKEEKEEDEEEDEDDKEDDKGASNFMAKKIIEQAAKKKMSE